MKNNLKELLGIPVKIYQKFNSLTKIKTIPKKARLKKMPTSWIKINYKSYARFPEIKLPNPVNLKTDFFHLLKKRSSIRNFSLSPLTLQKISSLLFACASYNQSSEKRTYPSAGGRYPLEIYLISLNTQLKKGVYHYYVKNHSLEKIFNINQELLSQSFTQKWVLNSAVIIVITAIFQRTCIKYGNRGYRYILLEAGHLGQNLSLACCANKLGCCSLGGFIDDNLNQLLHINGNDESVIYTFAVGNI